jgi:predicted RNase H-like nuclease (RuvC/YqgF family)
MKSNMPYKDTDGIYKYYCAKGTNAISFLRNAEDEVHRKAYEIANDEFLKMENMISDYHKQLKQLRDENWELMQFIARQNKEIREMKEGING